MAQPTYEQLLQIIELKDRRIGELEARVVGLQGQVAKLTQLLEQTQRTNKRQAAPFSKGSPKTSPKRPGRKPGPDYGKPAFRSAPPPGKIDEVHEAVLPRRCPTCGGAVHQTHTACQYQVEIPRKPIYRKFNVHVGQCTGCGRRVQGRHALQTSDALGAAASQLGPDLQAMLRAARRCRPICQAIIKAMPRQPWNVPNAEGDRLGSLKGWRIGGRLAWLHVFVAERITGYVIDRRGGVEVAEGVLGRHYAGTLIHDGWAPYDRFWRAAHQQCLAHLLRRCTEMIEAATAGAVRFPRQVKELLMSALDLRDRSRRAGTGRLSEHGLAVSLGRLGKRRDRLLRWTRTDQANERLAKHLHKHRDQLFTFLRRPGIDATNWRAEQAIRPAVVNRKVWGGNRTQAGAEAQSILTSILRTCAQQHRDALDFVSRVLRGQHPRLALAPM
jgi:transposase